ncbi:fas apoptotic inhibitory molecule (FAIM1) domain-containing protein [Ditylenchus destructor]|uniref:Fas apoptotic inhibitory molecule (FAIM1) domain-containing protein n=1 Tax=Ditylenchus destructor TaxID=166010 RepID=A0AAD4NG34_9BILA|nr:fas apoptotic inhibitory molecule (FAIM1) domain-containing protein [Ditylenchus destructor]
MAEADVVARWNVPMSDKVYKIEFHHGTTTGKRIVKVNGKEIVKRDWMFKLVGRELFEINNVKCAITIEAVGIFAYEYSLQVGGKSYEKFRDQQTKALIVWLVTVGNLVPSSAEPSDEELHDTRICLEKDTMDVWVNGSKAVTTGEFIDNGTRTHFEVGQNVSCYIQSESSGKRQVGLIHKLYVNANYIPPSESAEQ